MICSSAELADTTANCSLNEVSCWYIYVQRTLQLNANFLKDFGQSISLIYCTRETIQNETSLAIVLSKTLTNDTYSNFIWYQISGIHTCLCLLTQFGSFLNSSTEHVASRNMWNLELFNYVSRLSAFASTWRPH